MNQLSTEVLTHRVYLYPLDGEVTKYDIPTELALKLFVAQQEYRAKKNNQTFLINGHSFSTTNIDQIKQIRDLEKDNEIARTANAGIQQFEEAKKEIDQVLNDADMAIPKSKEEALRASNSKPRRAWECGMEKCRMWNPYIVYKDYKGHNKADFICQFCGK